MANFRRFQTGTLGRSVRRFGRFPRGRLTGFKRKQFGYFYSDADLQPEMNADPESVFLTVIDVSDLAPPAGFPFQTSVRNVSFDIYLGLTAVPDFDTALATYAALTWQWGFYKKDSDENNLDLDTSFATHSMIKWGCWDMTVGGGGAEAAALANPTLRNMTRVRFRVSELKPDENITFVMQRDNGVSLGSALEGIFLAFRMRCRYELP